MAKKRLTDVDKWKTPFLRSLPTEYKIFWLYILDDCDHCGIWYVDREVAEIRLGVKLSLEKARGLFGERVVEFDNGTKWFIPDFLNFQYGLLDDRNKMSKSILPTLTRYCLIPHLSPINGVKVTVTDKVMVKEEEIDEVSKYRIDLCLQIALKDDAWVRENKTDSDELFEFNKYLTATGEIEKVPIDYKRHFHHWKKKNPDVLKTKKKPTYDTENKW